MFVFLKGRFTFFCQDFFYVVMTSELWFEPECVVPSCIIILTPGSNLSEFSTRYPGRSRRRLGLHWPLENTRLFLLGHSQSLWSPLGPQQHSLSSRTLTLAFAAPLLAEDPLLRSFRPCPISCCAQTGARCYCPEAGGHTQKSTCRKPGVNVCSPPASVPRTQLCSASAQSL